MIERDNRDIQFTHLAMENVRLQNLVLEYEEELRLRDVEDAADKAQTAEMLASKDRQIAEQAALIESQKKDIERITADRDQERDSRIKAEEQKKALIIQLNQQKQDHEEEMKELLPAKEMLKEAEKNNVDCQAVIKMMLNREYNTNSDASRYMNGEFCLDDPLIQDMGLGDIVKTLLARTATSDDKDEEKQAPRKSPEGSSKPKNKKSQAGISKKRRKWTKEAIEELGIDKELGIDTSNLPKGAKLIKRKDKDSGYDIWYVELITYVGPKLERRTYCIGRFNVPGSDPMCSKYPESIIQGNPMTPSLAAFYFDQKIGYGMSEERILQMLTQMGGNIPQSTLNGWAHDVMGYLKDRLQEPMKDAIKLSVYTHNDGTHIIVRSWNEEKKCYEYHVEWIHGVLSPDMKTVVMLYADGSRSHTIQEEEIFKGSNIQSFIADRAPLYETLDDEKAFKAFLKNGRIELSNSAAERMFRHIAMGRRNWLHSGSHDAAQNIAFMYSLYESCKLNDLNFFDYINDVLTRLMKGETDYKSLIPCNYKPLPNDDGEGQKEAA
ncbi:MAG: transposase IS66 [bacterium P201]|nr:MAG: transposase IS66 [bacterium P201]